MSITATVAGFRGVPDGTVTVPTSKLALVRWGLVSARPWWISDPTLGRWTQWPRRPAGLRDVAGRELLDVRRVAYLLGAFLHEEQLGAPIETTPHFHALRGTQREQAAAQLDAAIAGQLAWSLLDVAALHHVGWTGPDLGLAPGPGRRRPDYAGVDTDDPARWIVLTAATCPDAAPATTTLSGREVVASGAVAALPADRAGRLAARLQQRRPDAAPDPAPDLDADALHEQRYARFAWAIGAGLRRRVERLGRSGAVLHLFRLGAAGFAGVTEDVATAIDDTLAEPTRGRRARFADRVRATQHAGAGEQRRQGGPKAILLPSRQRPRLAGPTALVLDDVPHDVALGPDGIALVLPSAIVRPPAEAGTPAVPAA